MAKQYTAREWAILQSRLPQEDRVPYELSPDKVESAKPTKTATKTTAAATPAPVTTETPKSTPTSTTAQVPTSAPTVTGTKVIDGRTVVTSTTPTPTPVTTTTTATVTPPAIPLTGAQRAEATIQARKDRFAAELEAREASKPTEDPGPGNEWIYSVAEGRWKRVFVGGFGSTSTIKQQVPEETPVVADTTTVMPVTTYTAPDGRIFTDLDEYNAYVAQLNTASKRNAGQSAWNLLKGYLDTYGLGVLANDIQKYIEDGMSYDELLLKLRTESPAYKRRFAANERRISKGLRALSEAEYINLEDDYQNIMRRYGMPESYYSETVDPTTGIKIQQGFEKFIEGDVSPVELEDRIQTAYNRVINAAPEVMNSLKQFYGDIITNGDILAYALDTKNAIENIKRKVGAAEIGAEALQAGLTTSMARAEELQRFGVTQAQAEQGFQAIADILPSAQKLSQIYAKQGLGEYNQTVAEQEAFGIPGSAEAGRKRRRLAELETAQFAGQAGTAQGALARERAGSI